jgi:hypothetical protein
MSGRLQVDHHGGQGVIRREKDIQFETTVRVRSVRRSCYQHLHHVQPRRVVTNEHRTAVAEGQTRRQRHRLLRYPLHPGGMRLFSRALGVALEMVRHHELQTALGQLRDHLVRTCNPKSETEPTVARNERTELEIFHDLQILLLQRGEHEAVHRAVPLAVVVGIGETARHLGHQIGRVLDVGHQRGEPLALLQLLQLLPQLRLELGVGLRVDSGKMTSVLPTSKPSFVPQLGRVRVHAGLHVFQQRTDRRLVDPRLLRQQQIHQLRARRQRPQQLQRRPVQRYVPGHVQDRVVPEVRTERRQQRTVRQEVVKSRRQHVLHQLVGGFSVRADVTREDLQEDRDVLFFAALLQQGLLHVPALLGGARAEAGAFRPVQLRPVLFPFGILRAVFVVVVLRLVGEDAQTGQEQVDDASVDADAAQEATVVRAQRRHVVQLSEHLERQSGERVGDGRLENVATWRKPSLVKYKK